MPTAQKSINIDPINFYTLPSVQKHAKSSINPGFKNHHISIPFRAIVCAASGGGKTNMLLNLLRVFQKTFNHVYIFTQAEETLYDWLVEAIDDPTLLTVVYNDLARLKKMEFYGQSLCVFDDQVNESKAAHVPIQELYIRGRKISGGVSSLYLTQSYYSVPKLIRIQCSLVMLLKLSSVRDIKLMVSEYSLSATKEQMMKMYEYCRSFGMENFMLIDVFANDEKKYRKNFNQFLIPEDFD